MSNDNIVQAFIAAVIVAGVALYFGVGGGCPALPPGAGLGSGTATTEGTASAADTIPKSVASGDIEFASPRPGETWKTESVHRVSWTGGSEHLALSFVGKLENGTSVEAATLWVNKDVDNTGSYDFGVPYFASGDYRFYLTDDKGHTAMSEYVRVVKAAGGAEKPSGPGARYW